MSRREIRRMLMEPRKRVTDRPWVVPLLMGTVLLAGVGIGVGAGIAILSGQPEAEAQKNWEQAEMALDRPPRREDQTLAIAEEASVVPIVPLPRPRPGGPADDGMVLEGEEEVPVQEAALPAVAAPAPPPAPEPKAEPAALPMMMPQPPVKGVGVDAPAWVRYAIPAPKVGTRPVVAIVIDDLGVDRKRSERVLSLRAPLTLAWMTYAEDLPRLTQAAHARGHELMVHVPMQPMGESYDPGPDVLETHLNSEEIRRRLNWGLSRFSGFVGINNHMGSRFTGDRPGMRVVMEELKKRGLLFLDSVTTGKSVAPELARNYGVPFAARQVFIDNEQSVSAVLAQLAKAEAHARKHGAAIAIGHPHDSTIEALQQWLPGLEARGVMLVPVTAIVKANEKPGG